MRVNNNWDKIAIAANQNKERKYWLNKLSGDLEKSFLLYDSVNEVKENIIEPIDFTFPGELCSRLMKLSKESDYALNIILQTGLILLLHKYTASKDIIIGTPIYKHEAETETGEEFINSVLVLRNILETNITFKELLLQVKQTVFEAIENQDYPIEILIEDLKLSTGGNGFPLFDIAILLENIHDKNYINPIDINLLFSFIRTGAAIKGRLEYNSSLYKRITIEKLASHYQNLLDNALNRLNSEISGIEILSDEEKQQILLEFSSTKTTTPEVKLIHEWFQEQVRKSPDHIALLYEENRLTYKELNERANRLARLLRNKGIKPGSIVAVMIERSMEMIIGIIGILKAGGAYLPIAAETPETRIIEILNDSSALILLTASNMLKRNSFTRLLGLQTVKQEPGRTAPRPPADFDSLPIPDRSLIDFDHYNKYIGHAMVRYTISMQATRGCPFHCTFCHRIWPKNHKFRSAENIYSEVELYYKMGVRRFVIIDDIFNFDVKNSSNFFKLILKNGLKVHLFFPNGIRGDILTKEYIDLMAEAGTVNVDLGLETASPRLQKLIKKNLNLDKLYNSLDYLSTRHPQVIIDLGMMIGFPTETEEEAMMTMDFLKRIKWVHFPYPFILNIHPNTEIGKLALEKGISPQAIARSMNYSYHDVPETLPFSKGFAREFRAKFLSDYFFLKERLLHVLPYQMKVATENELIQKYNNYLPMKIKSFSDINDFANISMEELGNPRFLPDDYAFVPGLNKKIRKHFTAGKKDKHALRILLLDVSELFSEDEQDILHGEIPEPLGLMNLMTYINKQFNNRVLGKIAKSRVDFDSYPELKTLIENFKPDLLGIRTLSYYKDFFHKTVSYIRAWGIDAPIVAGGPYSTMDYRILLQDPNVDLAVLGEGEITFAELVGKMIENNKKIPKENILQDIQGIAYIKKEEKALINKRGRGLVVIDQIQEKLARQPGENLPQINQANDPVYLIYTSGSTGKPKGVILEHRNLTNLLTHQYENTNIDFSSVLQFTTISFDVSSQEIFSTLLAGGQLSLISKETRNDIPALFKVVERNKIKTLFLPASFLKFVITEEEYIKFIPRDLNHMVTAGEQVVINNGFRNFMQKNNIYLHNHYGPAETHVVTALTLAPTGDIPALPSIGKPIINTTIFILDNHMHLLPVGVPGELYIGGIQVGRGYLNRPELTAEKFNHDLWNYQDYHDGYHRSYTSYKSYILYKTGDLARWQPDGNIEFLGRIDLQLKIRGFRVEVGEIESRLLNLPGIKETVVVARTNKNFEKYLCAYIVSDKELVVSELRENLAKVLPDFMIPAYFEFLSRLPLTSSGKIDRKALPAPRMKTGKEYTAPGNETEKKLAAIWSEVLGIDKNILNINADFFELGGHSLKATILASKIYKEFNVRISLSELFQRPTIKLLGQYIEPAEKEIYPAVDDNLVLLKKGITPGNNLFLIHDGSGEVKGYMEFCQGLNSKFNYWGIEADKLEDYTPINLTIEALAAGYIEKMKKIQPQGPYYILGWSLGGTITFEMTRQLEQINEAIAFLVLIDCGAPQKALRRSAPRFDLKSELKWMMKCLPGKKIKQKIRQAEETRQPWPFIVDYLENNRDYSHGNKIKIPPYITRLIPNFEHLRPGELFQRVNLIRALENARNAYMPPGKIHTAIHFFNAIQSKFNKDWSPYCEKPIKSYEVIGDHFSIFKVPGVAEFSQTFDRLLVT